MRRRPKYALTATITNKNGMILSCGENSYSKTHPMQAEFAKKCGLDHKVFLHAEIAALVKVRQGKPYKITIERFNKKGSPLNAEPCPICKMAIAAAGIKRIEYTI